MGPDVVCVYCHRKPVAKTWQPFCSERCKLLDFRNWVDECYRVQGESTSSLSEKEDVSPNRYDDPE